MYGFTQLHRGHFGVQWLGLQRTDEEKENLPASASGIRTVELKEE